MLVAVAVFPVFAAGWSCNAGGLAFGCTISAALSGHAAPVFSVHPVNAICCVCCGAKQVHPTKVTAKANEKQRSHQTAFGYILVIVAGMIPTFAIAQVQTLRACLEIEDQSKERLDCYDAKIKKGSLNSSQDRE